MASYIFMSLLYKHWLSICLVNSFSVECWDCQQCWIQNFYRDRCSEDGIWPEGKQDMVLSCICIINTVFTYIMICLWGVELWTPPDPLSTLLPLACASQAKADPGRSHQEAPSQFEIDMYALLYLERTTNKDLLYSTGNSAQHYVTT